MKLEVFRGRHGLEAVEDAWRELTDAAPVSALTQMVDYCLAYADAFEVSDHELVIASVRDSQGKVAAIAPLRLGEKKILGVNAKFLEFPDVPVPIRDIVVGPSLFPNVAVDFIVESISRDIGYRWDFIQFRNVLEGSALLARPENSDPQLRIVEQVGVSHLIDVSEPGYIANVLNANARNNLRRNQNKLQEAGDFEFLTVSEFPELETAYEHFLTTEAAGWKSVRGGKRAIKLHADQTRFYHDLMRRLAVTGQCHIHLLYLNGQPVASDYCVVSGDKSFSVKHGYDETYSKLAPGNLLRAYTIDYYEKSETVNSIDLLSGWDWQRRWRPERRSVFDIKIFRRSLLGSLLYHLSRIKQATKKKKGRGD